MKHSIIKTIFLTSIIVSAISATGWFYLTKYIAKKDLISLGITYSEASFVKTVCSGNTAASLLFIKSGMDVNTKAEGDMTALHCAAQLGYLDLIKALIENHADINAKTDGASSELLTPLHMASMIGNLDSVNLLIKAGADINSNSPQGTPLFLAAAYSNNNLVTTLINHGASTHIFDRWGNTALHAAVKNPNPESILDALISKGVDVNAKGKDEKTALHLAVASRNNNVVKKLIAHGADVNAVSVDGTPLMIAYSNKVVTESLLANSADPNISDKNGVTPLIYSARQEDNSVSNMLLAAGANVNASSASNETPLGVAARNGNLDLAKLLISKGAYVRVCCNKTTPLHAAVDNNNIHSLQMASLLLDAGADVNARNEAGRTPLVEARRAPLALVELLVSRGANINEKDDLGTSVLWWYQHPSKSPALDFLTSKLAGSSPTIEIKNRTAIINTTTESNIGDVNSEIQAVGVYQGTRLDSVSGQQRKNAYIQVNVRKSKKPIVLSLSSYEPITWILILEQGAEISTILLSGYHQSQVTGAGSARIITMGNSYAYKSPSLEYNRLNDEVYRLIGKRIKLFQGRYESSSFNVGGA